MTQFLHDRRRHPDIKAFMASQGWGEKYELLEDYYMDRLMEKTAQVTQDQMRYIVWQERKYLFSFILLISL